VLVLNDPPTRSFIDARLHTSEEFKQYILIILSTVPASIIFVYLNWLSVSFFKNA
jgi:hypothetical protein